MAKTKTTPDFSSVATIETPQATGQQLSVLVAQLRDLTLQAEQAEERAKMIRQQVTQLEMVDIPEAMAALSMTDAVLQDGARVVVKSGVNVYVRTDHQPEAYRWLREHGHGGVVKELLQVDARTLSDTDREALISGLTAHHVEYVALETVHPGTLKALIGSLLEQGITLPPVFSVHQYHKATVKEPKK
jgi:peptidyl-tRNA hydrolase